jgi:hypothetical protein
VVVRVVALVHGWLLISFGELFSLGKEKGFMRVLRVSLSLGVILMVKLEVRLSHGHGYFHFPIHLVQTVVSALN